MNRYLEKLAMFGFSKKEKEQKLHQKLWIDSYNHFADEDNKIIHKSNEDYEKEHGPDAFVNETKNGPHPDYLKHLITRSKNNKAMYDSYEPIWKKHKTKADKLGVDIGKSHKEYMDSIVESNYNFY